jgi:diguanylate cyclase (GGDEF)-like protein
LRIKKKQTLGEFMEKDDLKSLVTQMYKELLESIESQDEASKEHIINYLQNSVRTLKKINDEDIDSIEHAKVVFTNAYKEIANESIKSYKETNGKFQALSKLHQDTFEEVKEQLIDIPNIKQRFNEIQSHMLEEVTRANNVINKLTEQVKELEEDSNLDGLTKIFNRKALDNYLKKITKKNITKHDLYLLILDIDDFKSINDTYGHIVGDKILIFLAKLLRKTVREGDKVFRYGGEEFIIILNRVTQEKAQEIATRILKTINTNNLLYKNNSVKVTVSIGMTKYCQNDTPEDIIDRADKALYISKINGKNQLSMEFKDGN